MSQSYSIIFTVNFASKIRIEDSESNVYMELFRSCVWVVGLELPNISYMLRKFQKQIGSDGENWLYAYTKKRLCTLLKRYICSTNILMVRMQQFMFS